MPTNSNTDITITGREFIAELKAKLSKYESSEQLLRSGGISIELLDRLAFGFADSDIVTLNPDQIHIKWKDDLDNVKWEIKHSGLTPRKWAEKINLSEPIDVSYETNKKGVNHFYLEDGHHRYTAAKILKKPLNVSLEIKAKPVRAMNPNMTYDQLMRNLYEIFGPKNETIRFELNKRLLEHSQKETESISLDDAFDNWIDDTLKKLSVDDIINLHNQLSDYAHAQGYPSTYSFIKDSQDAYSDFAKKVIAPKVKRNRKIFNDIMVATYQKF